MVFDSESDKKMVLFIVANHILNGPYGKVGPAVRELDILTVKIEGSAVVSDTSKKELKK